MAINLGFLDWSCYFFIHVAHEAEWTLLQTHNLSESLLAPGIKLGNLEFVARNSDHYTT
jgi:hypothetical protein